MQLSQERESFFSERSSLLSKWNYESDIATESKIQQLRWVELARNKIPTIDILTFLDRVKRKTSQAGILDECIAFAKEQNLSNPLLYALTVAGFKTRKEYITTLMEQILINPSTQENN